MTLTHLQKMPKNVRGLDKLIVSEGFKKLPKVQKTAQSGHTAYNTVKNTIHQVGFCKVLLSLVICNFNFKYLELDKFSVSSSRDRCIKLQTHRLSIVALPT